MKNRNRRGESQQLYRKVNTRARHVTQFHPVGPDAKNERGTKRGLSSRMTQKRRGRDYTPLFRFLLTKVGCDWDLVHQEAVGRLDDQTPIGWMVATNLLDRRAYWITGESTYYSGMFVDEKNRLQLTNPHLSVNDFRPQCACCTYTFNGTPFVHKFDPEFQNLYYPS